MWKEKLSFVCQRMILLLSCNHRWSRGVDISFYSHPQINNKVCGTVTVPLLVSKDIDQVQKLVMESPLGQTVLRELHIKRAILSPRTALINFLVG